MAHQGREAVLMPCTDILVPKFGIIGLNDAYSVRDG